MPQATEEIRAKFMEFNDKGEIMDDGIIKAESIIEDAGGLVSPNGTIIYDGNDTRAWDAVNYLCNEWDYGLI